MTAKFAKEYGDKIAGALIADSQFALRMPTPGRKRPPHRGKRYYPDFAS